MASSTKLLAGARSSAASLGFREACRLAACFGFERARQRGSHRLCKMPGIPALIDFQQAKGGKAKPYQVQQLVALIDAYALEYPVHEAFDTHEDLFRGSCSKGEQS